MTPSSSAALQLLLATCLFGRGCWATGYVNLAPDRLKERATSHSLIMLKNETLLYAHMVQLQICINAGIIQSHHHI